MAASSSDHSASGGGGGVGCASADESACSTPFVSAPSSPDRDPAAFATAGCFYSVPASPSTADEYGCKLGFDFSSHCPPPAAAAMSSADELFHNGQIRPMRLTSFPIRPQVLRPRNGGVVPTSNPPPQPPSSEPALVGEDDRGRLRSRSSVNRRYRSLSPFRAVNVLLSPLSSPARAPKSVTKTAPGVAAPSASRSSSSSSTASFASSSSSRSYRKWGGFLKHIFHRSKSDGGGERPPLPSSPSPPAASRGRERARTRSAHARLYEARRAEAEEMRRRTFLPYRKGLFLGFLGLGSRGYGDMHSVTTAAATVGMARP